VALKKSASRGNSSSAQVPCFSHSCAYAQGCRVQAFMLCNAGRGMWSAARRAMLEGWGLCVMLCGAPEQAGEPRAENVWTCKSRPEVIALRAPHCRCSMAVRHTGVHLLMTATAMAEGLSSSRAHPELLVGAVVRRPSRVEPRPQQRQRRSVKALVVAELRPPPRVEVLPEAMNSEPRPAHTTVVCFSGSSRTRRAVRVPINAEVSKDAGRALFTSLRCAGAAIGAAALEQRATLGAVLLAVAIQ
jgi:hypothetical protein